MSAFNGIEKASIEDNAELQSIQVENDEKTPLFDFKSRARQRKIGEYYDKQVGFLADCYADKEHVGCNGIDNSKFFDEKERKERKRDEYLAKATLILNVVLLIAKSVAAYLSGSLAVISTVIESAVDITSGLAIWLTVRAIEKTDPFEYPRGRAKLEPLAIIIVSVVMGVASIQVIIQSVQSIVENKINPEVDLATMIIIGASVLTKVVLLIFCLQQKTPNAKLLALDQRNDIITNTFATVAAIIGDRVWLYADPLGAIIVSSFVCGCWFYVAYGQVPVISGKRASAEYINRIITLCCEHEPPVHKLDKVLVYHYGSKFLVEVRVDMGDDVHLSEANELVSTLQSKLELLPDVERAFVRAVYRQRSSIFTEIKLANGTVTKINATNDIVTNGAVVEAKLGNGVETNGHCLTNGVSKKL